MCVIFCVLKFVVTNKQTILTSICSKLNSENEIIPTESIKYLFERFYRVDKSRNRKSGGLGLGLAIVKEIVDSHGWRITVENVEQKGLKFIIGFRL